LNAYYNKPNEQQGIVTKSREVIMAGGFIGKSRKQEVRVRTEVKSSWIGRSPYQDDSGNSCISLKMSSYLPVQIVRVGQSARGNVGERLGQKLFGVAGRSAGH